MFKSRYWIFFVLAGFTLLLVPRNLWHDCEPYHAQEHPEDGRKSFKSDTHCFVCDFELSAATVHSFPAYTFPAAFPPVQNVFYGESQCIVPFQLLKLRGPPAELRS